ncbi:MAG: hypothetical protein HXY40_01995 [Chloroflexi bacterium]|nr:hypothetical protein [Chloroflexota bacterium]
MKKALLTLLLLAALLTVSGVLAQDEDPIEIAYGDVVDGEIDDDLFEVNYIFEGAEDDIVMIEMFAEPGTYDLDSVVQLKDDDGDVLFENDSFFYPGSVIVAQLRRDGQYIITATRYNGEEGSSEGPYMLRLTLVEPVQLGDTFETQIFSDYDTEETVLPEFGVLYLDSDVDATVRFEADEGDIFAAFRLVQIDPDAFSGYFTIADFSPGVPIYNMSFDVELQDETLYVFYAYRAFGSYAFEADPVDVFITIEER